MDRIDLLIADGDDEEANAALVALANPQPSRSYTKEDAQKACYALAQRAESKAEIVALIERFSGEIGYKFIVRALRGFSFERCAGR